MSETCETCRFFLVGKFVDRCRRYPPQRMPAMFNGFAFWSYTQFPGVESNEWCGEHSPLSPTERRVSSPASEGGL